VGVEKVGGHDWYQEGAREIVGAQRADGSWKSSAYEHHHPVPETCFAVLFLKRATRPLVASQDKCGGTCAGAKAIADAIVEARQQAPTLQEPEEGDSTVYSSERGSEPADDGDKKRRRRPRRRRAKPEAIAARLKAPGEGGDGAEAEGAEAEEGE